MAVLVRTRVQQASRADQEALGSHIEAAIVRQGRPPEGLMVSVVHPEDDGYVISEVWRTEEDARGFYDAVVLPAISATGRTAGPLDICAVWSFARP